MAQCTHFHHRSPSQPRQKGLSRFDGRFRTALKKELLLASQRIEVGALIRSSNSNRRAFRWAVAESETTNGAQVTRLEYARARSRAFFQFDRYRHQHYALYAWGDGEACEEHFVGSWPQQVRHLARWVAGLADQRSHAGSATHSARWEPRPFGWSLAPSAQARKFRHAASARGVAPYPGTCTPARPEVF